MIYIYIYTHTLCAALVLCKDDGIVCKGSFFQLGFLKKEMIVSVCVYYNTHQWCPDGWQAARMWLAAMIYTCH